MRKLRMEVKCLAQSHIVKLGTGSTWVSPPHSQKAPQKWLNKALLLEVGVGNKTRVSGWRPGLCAFILCLSWDMPDYIFWSKDLIHPCSCPSESRILPAGEMLTFLCAYGGWNGREQKKKGSNLTWVIWDHLGHPCSYRFVRSRCCHLPPWSWLSMPSFQGHCCPVCPPCFLALLPSITYLCPLNGWDFHLKAPLSLSFPSLSPAPAQSSAFQNICSHHRPHGLCLPTKVILKGLLQPLWTHSPIPPSRSFNFTGQCLTWRNVLIMVEFQASGVRLVSSIWPSGLQQARNLACLGDCRFILCT